MFAFNLVVLAAITLQGGQGGGGFGGELGGGGFGGGGFGGGLGGSYVGMSLPLQEEQFEHILTPGDKTDWPFEAQEGDVYIFRAESEIFDPAIEVTDPQDKKVGENDDEAPGKQNARLLVFFDKPGKFSAHVKNYHSTAGGRYRLFVRRYRTKLLPLDTDVKAPEPGTIDMFSLRLKKGEVVCFDRFSMVSIIVGPDGFPQYGEAIESGYANNFIYAEKSGVYLVGGNLSGRPGASAGTIHAHKARQLEAASSTSELSNELESGGCDAWKIHVKAGEFIQINRDPKSALQFFLRNPDKSPSDQNGSSGNNYRAQRGRTESSFQSVGTFGKKPSEKRYFFAKEGDYTLYVRSMSDKSETYKVVLSPAWLAWDLKSDIRARLEIGQTSYFKFVGNEDDILRFAISSRGFDIVANLYDDKLGVMSSGDDTTDSFSECNLGVNIAKTGTYYLSVRCNGDGGSGDYVVKSQIGHPQVIKFGETIEKTLTAPEDGVWKVTLPGSQKIAVVVVSDTSLYANAMDSDGKPINSSSFSLSDHDRYLVFPETAQRQPYVVKINIISPKPNARIKLSVISAAELAKRFGG